MAQHATISRQTRLNWLIDAAVFASAMIAALSGLYFLFVPSGGYQGGRNAAYGLTVLFPRSTWSDLHTWGGVIMVIAAIIHLIIHWHWITMMSKRMVHLVQGKEARMSRGAKRNLVINAIVTVSFLFTAGSGVYLLFVRGGGYQGGRNLGWDPGFLWSRTTWGLIHTWAGVILIIAAVAHFVIHWRWVKNVTQRFFSSLRMVRHSNQVPAR